jgi:phosphoenolpyruvate synthase/pyruvate phosphate dikinase
VKNTYQSSKGAEKIKLISQKQLIKLLKPNAREKRMLELAPYIVFFKDWRDDIRRKYSYYWSFLFQHMADYFNIKYDDLGYLTLDEIEQCLKLNKFSKDLVKKRKGKEYIVTSEDNKLKVKVINSVPKRYKAIINKVEKGEGITRIKGTIAQKGKVRGRVRIIRSYHDIKKVQKGEILVANTTHPDYLPAMQQAAAFVTNEGGIISHAAIVAREMKKPCIVGTKTATKVLNDEDLVEVDADKGVVRKIIK